MIGDKNYKLIYLMNKLMILFNNQIILSLLKGAEACGLKKMYKSGELKDFLVEDLENFENSGKLLFN